MQRTDGPWPCDLGATLSTHRGHCSVMSVSQHKHLRSAHSRRGRAVLTPACSLRNWVYFSKAVTAAVAPFMDLV